MAIVNAVITEDARKYWPQIIGGIFIPESVTNVGASEWDLRIKTFKVGEGGWIDPGTGAVPRTPDPALRRLTSPFIQDLDAIVDTTRTMANQRYTADSRATFEKTLTGGDFVFSGTSTIEITCLLDFGDFNDDGFGNDPEIFEIGVFSDHPVESGEKLMVAYGTFAKQTKNVAVQLSNIVKITF